jgi:ferredoxin
VTLTLSTSCGVTGVFDGCAKAVVESAATVRISRNLFIQPPRLTHRITRLASQFARQRRNLPEHEMADPNDKVPGQASGRYYVDSQCIDCDLCRETSPANFTRNDNECFSYVFKQPETPEEETLCKDALDNCPVEAIGNDG